MLADDFNTIFPLRQDKLRVYLSIKGPSVAELGRLLGVSKARARQIVFHAERVQKRTLEIMREAGIPEELLPGPALRDVAEEAAKKMAEAAATKEYQQALEEYRQLPMLKPPWL